MGSRKTPGDIAIHALVAEVERRRKLPGLHNYSYGRLIADTTEEERRRIVKRYLTNRVHRELERMVDYDSKRNQMDAADIARRLVERERRSSGQ